MYILQFQECFYLYYKCLPCTRLTDKHPSLILHLHSGHRILLCNEDQEHFSKACFLPRLVQLNVREKLRVNDGILVRIRAQGSPRVKESWWISLRWY